MTTKSETIEVRLVGVPLDETLVRYARRSCVERELALGVRLSWSVAITAPQRPSGAVHVSVRGETSGADFVVGEGQEPDPLLAVRKAFACLRPAGGVLEDVAIRRSGLPAG